MKADRRKEEALHAVAPLRSRRFAERVLPLVEAGVVSAPLAALVDALAPLAGPEGSEEGAESLVWAALTLEASSRGHSALPARRLEDHLAPLSPGERERAPPSEPESEPASRPAPLSWPAEPAAPESWGLVRSDPPLLEVHRDRSGLLLQLPRLSSEEQRVAEALVALARPVPGEVGEFLRPSPAVLERGRGRFPPEQDGSPHVGLGLVDLIAERRLCVVTGGPGTGKTWSIKRLLAMLLEAAAEEGRVLAIRLAAPTGKAAVRMREALLEDLDATDKSGDRIFSPEVAERLRHLEAQTLHRLLGISERRPSSRFGSEEPLPADVVVVDEVSMADLLVFRQLVESIGPSCRLILLGDRDQLPSVNVGSVLGDLVDQPLRAADPISPEAGPLGSTVVRFRINRRSGEAGHLAKLVEALQDASDPDGSRAVAILTGSSRPPEPDPIPDRICPVAPRGYRGRLDSDQLDALVQPWFRDRLRPPSKGPSPAPEDLTGYAGHLEDLLSAWPDPLPAVAAATDELLRRLDRYRVLAVHNQGPTGVAGLSRALEHRLRTRFQEAWSGGGGKGPPAPAPGAGEARGRKGRPYPAASGLWLGQAVLVTRNSYDVGLWNGDIGLVLPDPSRGHQLAVAFPTVDEQGLRTHWWVPLDRLPEHQTAFVLTIHKAQGSQFDHVAVVLSPQASLLQRRELVYTGITRASQRVTWYGTPERLAEALRVRVVRGSRLGARLAALGSGGSVLGGRRGGAGGAREASPERPRPAPVAEPGPGAAPEIPSPGPATTAPAGSSVWAFLERALPADGSPISSTALGRLAQAEGVDPSEAMDALEEAEREGRVAHEGRSWIRRSASLAPASLGPEDVDGFLERLLPPGELVSTKALRSAADGRGMAWEQVQGRLEQLEAAGAARHEGRSWRRG